MLKISSISIHIFSQPLSKTLDSFVLLKISHIFTRATFNSEWLYFASDEAFKKLRASLSIHDICRGFIFEELAGHCFL